MASKTNKNLNVHIVGGSGQMGTWLKNFLESQNISVTTSGRKNKNEKAIKNSDIIFISVPISVAPAVISQISKVIKNTSLIVDLSSRQSETEKVFKKISNPSLCLHFLFGPTVSSVQNQKIVFSPVKNNKQIEWLKNIFINSGAEIIVMKPEEHDHAMANIQGLIHFVNVVLGKTLLDENIDSTTKTTTPSFLSQLSTLSRVLSQNPHLISEIQINNPYVVQTLEKFLENYRQYLSLVEKKNATKFENEIQTLHKYFSPEKNLSQKKSSNSHFSERVVIPKDAKTGYLGPAGTYCHQALVQIASSKNNSYPQSSIYDIFKAVSDGQVDFGVVPAENSTEGTIRETLDYLLDFNVKTNGSIDLPIHHSFIAYTKNKKEIKKIISHPQAIAQCRQWIHENFPRAIIEYSQSTVGAIEQNKNANDIAFIASSISAKIYNAYILAQNIEDEINNVTRFYLISKQNNQMNSARTLIFLTVFNRVGILNDILRIIAQYNINLTKIESRPSREKMWDYYFFVELDIKQDNPKVTEVLNILKKYCPVIKILGGV